MCQAGVRTEAVQTLDNCPKCNSVNIYQEGLVWICPECNFEWAPAAAESEPAETATDSLIRDAHGNILTDGDTITVIKDLKIKGTSSVVKVGTKAKNIRLTNAGDGHDISCKIDGFGVMNLKSEFVKKV